MSDEGRQQRWRRPTVAAAPVYLIIGNASTLSIRRVSPTQRAVHESTSPRQAVPPRTRTPTLTSTWSLFDH